MAMKILSPFPYYGGKAKMASLICDMLDYNHTDTYVEPFGGACRVLLNKPRHNEEIYNDSSAGLCAFMQIMSNRDTAYELIDRLYHTEYSPEEFNKAVLLRNEAEDNFIDEFRRQAASYVKQLLEKYDSKSLEELKSSIKGRNVELIQDSYYKLLKSNILNNDELVILSGYQKQFEQYMEIYKGILLRAYKQQYKLNFNVFRNEARKLMQDRIEAKEENTDKYKKLELRVERLNLSTLDKKDKSRLRKMSLAQAHRIAYAETANNHDNIDTDDMDLAEATYIIYSQSRDGMGTAWSHTKYSSTDDYHSQISRLYEVAERLEGVHVSQVGALSFILDCTYLNDPRAMIYCDPSYLKPGQESKNLGMTYKESFTYEDHEEFLKAIYKAKCKLLVSNYDTKLYNRYLNEANGWKRIEFRTTTSVGGTKDNERIEVLWYKY